MIFFTVFLKISQKGCFSKKYTLYYFIALSFILKMGSTNNVFHILQGGNFLLC